MGPPFGEMAKAERTSRKEKKDCEKKVGKKSLEKAIESLRGCAKKGGSKRELKKRPRVHQHEKAQAEGNDGRQN